VADGAAKVWTIDDDDVPDPTCLERLLAASQGVDVVFPLQRKPQKVQGFPPSWNGPLIDAGAIRAVGVPRADLFFWAEDTEFFYRVRMAGIPIRQAPDATLFHANPEDRPRGSGRDWRLYYEVRNLLWFRIRVRKGTPRQLWRAARALFGKLGAILLLEPGKGASLRLWWLGVRDFALNRMGRRIDPQTWDR
jgi:GT2 family glycosyltransferase